MYKIAVTGHRSNRISVDTEIALTQIILRCLSQIKTTCTQPIHVISALAEGADRIVVEAALELDVSYSVLLPFPPNDYATDFETDESKQRFASLLARASAVKSVLAERADSGTLGYQAVGKALLKDIDALIAIWDGEPARGQGGTAEVVQNAVDAGYPVLWLYPHSQTAVRLICRHTGDKDVTVHEHGMNALLTLIPV
jgi:hypothetical protein